MWRMDVQRGRYGPQVYIKDDDGYYICFFKGCSQKFKSNFSRHVESHEKRNDEVDEEVVLRQLDKYRDHPDMHAKGKPRLMKKKVTVPLSDCKKILDSLKKRAEALFFLQPVSADDAPDYYNIITDPIDLGSISERLSPHSGDSKDEGKENTAAGVYKSSEDFFNDVRRVWKNAKQYNSPDTQVWLHADYMGKVFEAKIESAKIKIQATATQKKLERYGLTELSLTEQLKILDGLQREPMAWLFVEPIDVDKWELPDYHQLIKTPMDFTTIQERAQKGRYSKSYVDFANDVRLVFRNAMVYNDPSSDIYDHAEQLSAVFERELENTIDATFKKMIKENRPCIRDNARNRTLFWDDERQQYYFEFYDTEDPSEAAPPTKKIKIEEGASGRATAKSFHTSTSRKDTRFDPVWICWRPRGSASRKPVEVSKYKEDTDDDFGFDEVMPTRKKRSATPSPATPLSTTPSSRERRSVTNRLNADADDMDEDDLVDVTQEPASTASKPATPSPSAAASFAPYSSAQSTPAAHPVASPSPQPVARPLSKLVAIIPPAASSASVASAAPVKAPATPAEPPKSRLTLKLSATKVSSSVGGLVAPSTPSAPRLATASNSATPNVQAARSPMGAAMPSASPQPYRPPQPSFPAASPQQPAYQAPQPIHYAQKTNYGQPAPYQAPPQQPGVYPPPTYSQQPPQGYPPQNRPY